jgi:hypothetical protein
MRIETPCKPARAVVTGGSSPLSAYGGFLIRLANFAHLDNQSDSEKKAKCHSKALGEKRPNPGSFWFTTQELQSGQFGLRMAQTVHISSTYSVSLLSYSIAVDIRRLQCNMSKQHVLALGLCG